MGVLLICVTVVSLLANALATRYVTLRYRDMTADEQAQVHNGLGYDQATATLAPIFVSAPGQPCQTIAGYEYVCDQPSKVSTLTGITLGGAIGA